MPPRRSTARESSGAFEPATARGIDAIVTGLQGHYPDADCELTWRTPLELLVKTILSAQSTDVRVNEVGKTLFRKYRSARAFAEADPAELEVDIKSTGFFRQKTKSVIGAARRIVDEHGGRVPRTMEELVELPGVARKTANVVLGTAFGIPSGFVVDTHVKRLGYRLGLSEEGDPVKIERDLMARFPSEEWVFLGHALIWHGRRVCVARKPKCGECALRPHCPRNGVD
ncbi:MAG TPA: endonuclease III [Thermoanaerobaculia bacterium]|nr:endonuclease III [Thermoanaerobaculia bacterium]